jgi:hydrogenase maturation protein HypF
MTPVAPRRRRVRRRIAVAGAVQGVGFRPFAFRLAHELGLAGFAGNDGSGAFVEVEGPPDRVDRFAQRLVDEAPPLARIESIIVAGVAPRGDGAFTIVDSVAAGGRRTLVPPDTATCDACLAEVADPGDRRHRHPFANCTDCGPRFTIIRELPYDRPATTMDAFAMCPACAAEYADPHDRRHHAQPISCPDCGPRLTFRDAGPVTVTGTDAAIGAVHDAWAAGRIVAIKGIGGYHLTCDAGCEEAVSVLRARKGRVDKPFALMIGDLDTAQALVELDRAAVAALTSPARPIVLARRRAPAAPSPAVVAGVAPGIADLGVMLPCTALHALLLSPVPGRAGPLPPPAIVATSGNLSTEPICIGDDEARDRLAGLADAFLRHDREIHVACDDSVVRISGGAEQPVRRSRGYAPLPVALPVAVAPTLAVGGELKATFCLAADRHGWMSQHIGDLENLETLQAFTRSVAAFAAMYRVTPAVIAVDMHPGYLSRRWAYEHRGDARVVEVQHHHAHVASLMAEHGLERSQRLVAIVADGTGWGPALGGGPAAWGGEILVAGYDGYDRAAHLAELPLPGGDGAVRHPCRLALAYLAACGIEPGDALGPVRATSEIERRLIARQVQVGTGVVPTTSLGRLFDAVASLLDVRHHVGYEAQAAIELEALAATAASSRPGARAAARARAAGRPAHRLRLDSGEDGVIDPAPLLRGIVGALARGADRAQLALAFHVAVADAFCARAARIAARSGLGTVGLTGGVFQNTLLSGLCRAALTAAGLRVLEHRIVPPNDGGLALGQAVIAGRIGAHHRDEETITCA